MKLSTKGRYGMRAMIDIALHAKESLVPISLIAKRQDISESYLEQLMAKLKKSGLVKSSRGAQGGYELAKEPDQISVGDILRALEGDINPVNCPGIVENGEGEGCSGADLCVTKYVWKRINDSINQTVDEITLDTLIAESKQLNVQDAVEATCN